MTINSSRLAGHVAVVTGAANGIGRAYALRLAAEGAAVAVVDIAVGSAVVDEITAVGGTAASFTTDVSDPDQVAALQGQVEGALGVTDILINNAGIYPHKPLVEVTIEDWRRMFAVNVESMFLTVQAFSPAMKQRGWGRIVNMTSDSIGLVLVDSTPYIASKMAIVGLTRGVATELAEFGVTANAVAPSAVQTPGTAAIPPDAFQGLSQMQAIKRIEQPEDLVGTVAFLVSDDAAFLTGQVLYVDGGLVRAA